MATSSDNDDYSIYVGARRKGTADDKSLSSPRVCICWHVVKSYTHSEIQRPKEDHSSRYTYEDELTNNIDDDDMLLDMISGMVSRLKVNLPFELDSLFWKVDPLDQKDTGRQLNGVDDMMNQIVEVVNDALISGRNLVDLYVRVEKQYRLTDQEYQAKIQAILDMDELIAKEKQLIDNYERACTMLRSQLVHDLQDRKIRNMAFRVFQATEDEIFSELKRINSGYPRRQGRMSLDHMLLEMRAVRESIEQATFRPNPAKRAAVEALETLVLDDKHGSSSSNLMCVICREEMLSGVEVKRMPCSHMFHGGCISKWLNQWGHTCPLCKLKLPTE